MLPEDIEELEDIKRQVQNAGVRVPSGNITPFGLLGWLEDVNMNLKIMIERRQREIKEMEEKRAAVEKAIERLQDLF